MRPAAPGTIPATAAAGRVSISRFRPAPGAAEILVRPGDAVDADDAVARIEKPGAVHAVDVAALLGIPRGRIAEALAVKAGDAVAAGQVLAESRALFGLWRARAVSPVDGSVDTVSTVTGQVVVRARPIEVTVRAFASGRVESVRPGVGVGIRAEVALLQGILGLGGEATGTLALVDPGEGRPLGARELDGAPRGAVVATPGAIGLDALRAARGAGVAALVGGSIRGDDLLAFMGAAPNLAAAGDEPFGFALLVTEGFGAHRMAGRAADLLRRLAGARVSVNGATQVRAGVIRPDLLGPPVDGEGAAADGAGAALGVGARARIVRGRRFGAAGEIRAVPEAPDLLGSGARALVYELRLEDGTLCRAPRQNVEAEG